MTRPPVETPGGTRGPRTPGRGPVQERLDSAQKGVGTADTPGVEQRHGPATITTHTDRVLEFDLTQMTDEARASWLAVYELGVRDGWARGYEAAEDDMAAHWARAHAIIQAAARHEPYDVLADRRGEHTRAQQHRTLLQALGVA